MSKINYKSPVFIAVSAIGVLTAYMFRDYLATIILSIISALLFFELFKKISNQLPKNISAFITVSIIVTLFFLPIFFLLAITVNELDELISSENFNQILSENNLESLQTQINSISSSLPSLNLENLRNYFNDFTSNAGSFFVSSLFTFGQEAALMFAKFILFLMLTSTIFTNNEKIQEYIEKLSPFSKNTHITLYKKINRTVIAVFNSFILVSILQAFLAFIIFLLLDISYIWLWTVLTFLFAVLPLGTGFVLFPMSIVFLATGRTFDGLVLFFYTLFVVTLADNIVRPYLASGENLIPASLILLGFLGGVTIFGFSGIIIGPILIVILAVFLNLLFEESVQK